MSLIAAAVAGSAVALTAWHGATSDPEVGGYPQRIGFERPSAQLPDRPGPLAATMYDNDFGNGRDLGVTSTGHLWELPRGTHLLSPSGRVLLTQPIDGEHQLAGHDLVSGDRWLLSGTPRWSSEQQTRTHWSPDETAVLGSFARDRRPGRRHTGVLDLVSGTVTWLGSGEPAGFRSSTQPVTVHKLGGPGAAGGIVATTTDLDTGANRDLSLRLVDAWLGDPDSALVATISPDGQTIGLVEGPRDRSASTRVRMFSMSDGAEGPARRVVDWDGCSPTWLDRDPVLPTTSQPGGPGSTRAAGAALLTDGGSTSLVAVHPRLQSTCLQLAVDALAAGPRWALFGTSTAVWAWYPLPALTAATLMLAGLLTLYGLVATRRRNRAGRT